MERRLIVVSLLPAGFFCFVFVFLCLYGQGEVANPQLSHPQMDPALFFLSIESI